MKKAIKLFLILISMSLALSCDVGGSSDTPAPDTTAPTPGNSGTITATNVAHSSLVLNWTKATDNTTKEANLEYQVYYSESNNIGTVANAEANGTAVGTYIKDIATAGIDGLTASTTYYFNVIVKDEAGNKAAYTVLTQATAAPGAPAPGNSGTITSANVTETTMTLNWTKATDDVSPQSSLEYLVYYSTSNNISTVANAESNGTAVGTYAANISTKNIINLTDSTTYYFNVIVKNEEGKKSAYDVLVQSTVDTASPTPGNSGTITSANVTDTTMTLNWTKATDNGTSQANLMYIVYYSTSNNISSLASAESNGTAVGTYNTDIATRDITNLTGSTTYYFNVVVKDEAGNRVVYTTLTQATADATTPTPGNSGTITSANVAETTMTLNWTKATDDVSTQSSLEYLVYYSTSDNISTVADAESNGTAVGTYAVDIATKNITDLTNSTTYYFNIIVKDEAGNKAVYSTLTQATVDPVAPTPGNSGTITSANVTDTTMTLNWTKATDNSTSQANLMYIVYYSTSDNIDTLAQAESNGTSVGTYDTDIVTKNITNLTGSTTYYFNVVVKDAAGNRSVYTTLTQATADATTPTPGNSGTITSANVTETTMTLNWTKATDDVSTQSSLEYLVYYSTSNNISTVTNAEGNGIAFGSYASDIATMNITDLTNSTTYYFNIIVKDEAGNKAVYSTLTQATVDPVAPTPGNSGNFTSPNKTYNSITFNWTEATDNLTSQSKLEYIVYYYQFNTVDSLQDVDNYGVAFGSYEEGISTQTVTGLDPSTTYYFNIVVRDEAGNRAIYYCIEETTYAAP